MERSGQQPLGQDRLLWDNLKRNNCMEILYKFFKTWFDYFRSHTNGKNAMDRAIVAIIIQISFIGITLCLIYKHIVLGETHVFKPQMENKMLVLLVITAYFLILRRILKKIIIKYLRFDAEKGVSDKFIFESTKKLRTLNILLFCGIFTFPLLLLYTIRYIQN